MHSVRCAHAVLYVTLFSTRISAYSSTAHTSMRVCITQVATGFVKYAAIGAALFMGCLVGNSLTPYVVWKSQRADLGLTVHPLDFVFSQCVGIYMSSTIVFVLQGLQVSIRKRPFYKVAVRPAFISGVLWALGLVSQLIAATELPYAVAYPLCAIGPVFVSTIWSVCVYKELDGQGNRNYKFLTLALSTMIVGIFLMAYSTL